MRMKGEIETKVESTHLPLGVSCNKTLKSKRIIIHMNYDL